MTLLEAVVPYCYAYLFADTLIKWLVKKYMSGRFFNPLITVAGRQQVYFQHCNAP